MDGFGNGTCHHGYQTVTIHLHLVIISAVSSSLSIVGAFVIFVTYFTIQEIRNFTRLLLLYLTMADVMTAVGNLIAVGTFVSEQLTTVKNGFTVNCTGTDSKTYDILSVCVIQSFLTTYSNLVSFFWTVTLAFHLWSSVVLKSWRTEMLQTQIVYHLICWIVPFAVVFALLVHNKLGEDFCYGTGLYCGIRATHEEAWTRYLGDVAWQISFYLIATILYIHMKFYLKLYYRGQTLAKVAGRLRNEDKNFLFIWVVIYLLKLWGIIRFFTMMYTPWEMFNNKHLKRFLEFLHIMQSYGANGQAFWNCVVFCFFDRTVREKIKAWFRCDRSNPTDLDVLSTQTCIDQE